MLACQQLNTYEKIYVCFCVYKLEHTDIYVLFFIRVYIDRFDTCKYCYVIITYYYFESQQLFFLLFRATIKILQLETRWIDSRASE